MVETATASQPDVLHTRIGVTSYFAPTRSLSEKSVQESLRQMVSDCVANHDIQVAIDLVNIPTLNSTAMETLLDCHDMLLRVGGRMSLENVNLVNRDALWITDLVRFIHISDSSGKHAENPREYNRKPELKRLGDMLVDEGLLSEDQIEQAISLQSETGKRMGRIIIDKQWVSESDMFNLLGKQLGIPYVHLRAGLFDPDVLKLLDKETARRLKVLPLFKVRDKLILATADPQAMPSIDEVREKTGLHVSPILVLSDEIMNLQNDPSGNDVDINDYIGDMQDDLEVVESLIPDDYTFIDEMATGSPVINLVNAIIQRAIRDNVSDIHIEPSRSKCRVRFRIDGILYELMSPALEMHPAIVSRLKVMANLDIAERRLPQDGRIQVNTQGRVVDLRFSSLPGIFGEKLVLRVLDKNQSILEIDKLGMHDEIKTTYSNLLKRSHGLVLVTGPTGSGKTTTLYAAINHLNSIEKSIVTIEDPVEYQLDIVNQNQVNDKVGLSFAKLLKHVLRQDPDIVMVGEIRDQETAEIAVQAALTGHLVLSTLHTNESAGAITRMLEMGIEPFLLSSALIGVVAQRLVRTICPECKTSYVAPPNLIERYNWQTQGQVRLMKGRGCSHCYDSGYRGRMAIHEILPCNSGLQKLMISSPTRDELAAYLAENNVARLFDDGLQRVLEGRTTLDEISRVVEFG